MKGGPSLSSARTYTLIVLLAAYLGFDLAKSYSRRIELLVDARRCIAAAYILKNYQGNDSYSIELAGVGKVNVSKRDPPNREDSLSKNRKDFLFAVDRSDERRWAVEVRYDIGEGSSMESTPESNASRAEKFVDKLKTISINAGLEAKNEDYIQMFHRIEFALADQEVKLPGLELAARTDVAPWFIAILIVGLMVQIRNQIRRVFWDETFALDESWLILDAASTLEKLVALGWLLAIFLAPWLAIGSILTVVTGGIIADGAISTLQRDLTICCGLGLLIAVGGWLSLSVVSELLRLRRLRLEKLAESSDSNTEAALDY